MENVGIGGTYGWALRTLYSAAAGNTIEKVITGSRKEGVIIDYKFDFMREKVLWGERIGEVKGYCTRWDIFCL